MLVELAYKIIIYLYSYLDVKGIFRSSTIISIEISDKYSNRCCSVESY